MTVNHQGSAERGPVFVTGTGRCGTTIIYHVLAMHPDLAWIPSWVDAFPGFPTLATANRIWDLPLTDRFRETRFMPKPVECVGLFSRLLPSYDGEGFTEQSVHQGSERLVSVLERIRRAHGKPRFLGKLVGRPVKVAHLARLFPKARFIHITRQLKPTVSSIMKVDFYRGWGSLDEWRWDRIPTAYLEYFESTGRSEEVGVAITVERNLAELRRQFDTIDGSRWIELPYAEFVQAPLESLRTIGRAHGLRMPEPYLARVSRRPVYKGADLKWRQHFTEEQVARLDQFESLISERGYAR